MKKTRTTGSVLDALSLQELCRFCDADEGWIVELVEHGILDPRGPDRHTWEFRGVSIANAKKARRLNRDLGINAAGVAMVIDLLRERDRIMRRLARYEEV